MAYVSNVVVPRVVPRLSKLKPWVTAPPPLLPAQTAVSVALFTDPPPRISSKASKFPLSDRQATLKMLDFAIGLLAGEGSSARTLQLIAYMVIALPVIYLFQLNRLLSRTPEEVRKLSPTRWTKELLQETYAKLSQKPISIATYADQLPPKLERRYIVTGGSGTWPT